MKDDIKELGLHPLLTMILTEAKITKISTLLSIDKAQLLNRVTEDRQGDLKKALEIALKKYGEIIGMMDYQKEILELTEILDERLHLKKLKLTKHAETCLSEAGITTITQIKKMGEDGLKKIHTLGKKDRKIVLQKLKNYEDAETKAKRAGKEEKKNKDHRRDRLAKRAERRAKKRVLWELHDKGVVDVCGTCRMFMGTECRMYAAPIAHCPKLQNLPKKSRVWPNSKEAK